MRSAGRGARPKKRFGQHFLHDPAVIERIAAAIAPASGDALVEIGPGRGALTRHLLESDCASLDAIEIDRDLAAVLCEEWSGDSRFCLRNEDALRVDFGALARQRGAARLRVGIGNPSLQHLHAAALPSPPERGRDPRPARDVTARGDRPHGAARAGDRAYGRLTVQCSHLGWRWSICSMSVPGLSSRRRGSGRRSRG